MRIILAGPTDTLALAPMLGVADGIEKSHAFAYMADVAIEYLKRGHCVHVVALSENVKSVVTYETGSLTLTLVPQRTSSRARSLDFFRRERQLLRSVLGRMSADVVHAHWTYEYAWASIRTHRHVLVSCHDSPHSVLRYYKHPLWLFRELFSMRVLRMVTHVTAVSPQLAREIHPYLKRSVVAEVVVNGVSRRRLSLTGRESVKSSEAPVFAVVANGFDSRKNSAAVIRAFELVRRQLPGASLLLIGDGHEAGGRAESWSRRRGVSVNGIRFMGRLENASVQATLEEIVDVVVHPSRWEACSIAIMEAQAFGIPVIGSSKVPGVEFSLDHGNAGLLTKVNNAERLSSAMILLCREPSVYRKISYNSLKYLRLNFDLEDVIDSYLDRLARILV